MKLGLILFAAALLATGAAVFESDVGPARGEPKAAHQQQNALPAAQRGTTTSDNKAGNKLTGAKSRLEVD